MGSAVHTVEHRRWSTGSVDSQQALAYWIDTICNSFLEVDIDSPQRGHFSAHLDQSDFGPATLCLVEADAQTVRRTRARIARSRYETFFLLRLRAGQMRLHQYGREAQLQAGDCILIDCNEPYRLDCLAATRCVALRFPHEWLRTWIPAPQGIAARPFASTGGWSAALSAALANLDTDASELALPEGVVAEQLAALLALSAGPCAPSATSRDKLMDRLLSMIRDRCYDPDFTPTAVADAHGISKRYLHSLFARSGTTFGSELMSARLQSAQRLLGDQRFAGISVGEVAARCGFVDPSHFARRFRKAYGVGPMEYRSGQRCQ